MGRSGSAAIVLTLLVVGAPHVASARCDPSGDDAADVAAARAAIHASCGCEDARDHRSYVRCARAAAKAALANESCLAPVLRCEARSTCGRPGAVACCQTTAMGVTRAGIKGQASACRAPRGGSACVSPNASVCDACTAAGCAPPRPTPGCGNGIVDPGEDCDAPTCSVRWVVLDGIVEVQSECGAPGTLHPCECKGLQCGGCSPFPGPGPALCWQSDACVVGPCGLPGCPCLEGTCVPTLCETPSDCFAFSGAEVACEDGRCCLGISTDVSAYCRIVDQFVMPCCGAAICGAGDFATCCLPAGEPCPSAAACCSGSCTAGSCD